VRLQSLAQIQINAQVQTDQETEIQIHTQTGLEAVSRRSIAIWRYQRMQKKITSQ
jgi:hypothetical protein